jgi:hypothetical protein
MNARFLALSPRKPSPSSLWPIPQLYTGAYVRTSVRGPKTMGEALRQPFVSVIDRRAANV